jgi:hypothetical protein
VVNKSSVFLFILRFFFYFVTALLPVLHPGISISYDRSGLVQWFLIIPYEMLIAFLPAPRASVFRKGTLAILPLFFLSVYAGGAGPGAAAPFVIGLLSFTLTLLLFRYPRWGKASVLEPFFLAWICLRLLAYSRSGEEAAGQGVGLTPIILAWTAVVFLLHSAVVFFCLYPQARSRAGGETAVFALLSAAALGAVFVLPADFVRNTVIANLLPDRIDERAGQDDSDWGIPDKNGGRKNGRPTLPGGRSRQAPELRGLSEHEWPGEGRRNRRRGSGQGGEEQRQYTVMVVASKQEPVYMGNSFRGLLDPVKGFLSSEEEPLNRLPSLRLISTWFNDVPEQDLGREPREVFSLSTLPQNFLPYRPLAVEPTILSENTGPLRYIHRVAANMQSANPLELAAASGRDLSGRERAVLAPYLELPLEEADLEVFISYLDEARAEWQEKLPAGAEAGGYASGILAILTSFDDYQYNISDDDDSSIAALKEFLLNTRDGDCVEFSNAAALLGRLAGIPSRVVTGFLASESLQTNAHLRGLAALRNKIKVLQNFPFEDLYLVTDAHSHSWPQFYIPDYGWIDFEATEFAIPPVGFGDGNMRDVVIPLFDETKVFSQVRAFPWRAVLRALGFLAAAALAGAYMLRYGRELLLRLGARRGGRAGARSLYLLLLARLAADGRPIKPASKTAAEYARLFPGEGDDSPFAVFAGIYSELRWRDFADPGEAEARFRLLRQEYRDIITAQRRRGLRAFIIRIFSLRGLAYL